MFCPQCGKETQEGQRFCRYCGATLTAADAAPPAATPPAAPPAPAASVPPLPPARKLRLKWWQWALVGLGALAAVICLIEVLSTTLSPEYRAGRTATAEARLTKAAGPTDTSKPTNTPGPTHTPRPTNTPRATNTPRPSNTPRPPTATPDPNLIRPGTYIVGTDIQAGIYRGQAGEGLAGSCYWARLKDVSGALDAIISNDNSVGQFYVEVQAGDYALETRCPLTRLVTLPEPPAAFPTKIAPGMYLVGRDIQPGRYKGEGGADVMSSCYWARLKDVSGGMGAIIANDNSIGQFYVDIRAGDFAFETKCELEFTGE